MNILLQTIIFLITYFISGVIVSSLLNLIFNQEKTFKAELTIFGFGLGPMIISFFLFFLYSFFPNNQNYFYILIIGLIFLSTAVIIRKQLIGNIRDGWSYLATIPAKIKSSPKDILIIKIIIILICLYVFIQAIVYPILSRDASIYALYGQGIYLDHNLKNYPMTVADPRNGFFFSEILHPPALSLIYSWFYLLQGNIGTDILVRTVSPMYFLYLVILLWTVLRRRANEYTAAFGVLLLVFTPILISQTYQNGIDTLRIFFIFSSFILMAQYFKIKKFPLVLLAIIALSFALYSHITGIFAFIVVILIYFFFARTKIKQKILVFILICILPILIGGMFYIINSVKTHSILGQRQSYYQISNADFYSLETQSLMKPENSRLNPKWQIFIFIRSQMFSRPELHGFSYYILILAIIYLFILRKIKIELIDKVFLSFLLLFMLLILYRYYLNSRYIMTILPFVAYFDGLVLGKLYIQAKQKKITKIIWLIIIIIALATVVMFFVPTAISSRKLKQNNSKLKYLISNKKQQNLMIHPGLYEGIDFIDAQTPPESIILTTDGVRFFYTGHRKGIYWFEPRMKNFFTKNKEEIYQDLLDLKVDYIFIDPISKELDYSYYKKIKNLLEDQNLCYLLMAQDGAEIYKVIKPTGG